MCHPLQSAIIWKREFPQPHVLIFFLIPFSFSIISTVSRGKVFKGDPKKSWFRYIQCLVSDLALIGHSNFVGFFSEYFFHCFEFFIFIFFSFQTAKDRCPNAEFVQNVTFEPLMDFIQNHCGSWKCYKSYYF